MNHRKNDSCTNETAMPELLAPAGGWPQLKAAVQNGADAVYLGGPLFNARIKAENFTGDDLTGAIRYAHERNVKVYITLNTLIRDDELFEAFSYVDFLWQAGADAVILQDMGLARLIRKYLPDMSMHLSTQGTVYNKWAVELAQELGFSRIVPARELTLEEIEEFTEKCHHMERPCQVEVFVHGALCMCYSGQCQMSRMLGGINGRSGNRGLCAQPCRLPYRDVKGKQAYLLSPKDICTLEHIPQLCRAGVDSFKIEGRLKSAEYVAVVTSIYRKYLDRYAAQQAGASHGKADHIGAADASDMRQLLQIFNRGGFSTGYLFGNPGRKLLSGESPKNRGLLLGKVKGVKGGSTLVDIGLESGQSLAMGDGVEIRSRQGAESRVTGNVISYCKALSGGLLRIGDIKGKVQIGDPVYKVTDKSLLKKAQDSYVKERKAIPVEMEFTARIGKPPELLMGEAGAPESHTIRIYGKEPVEKAHSKATEANRIRQQLAKLGDTPFEAGNIDIQIDEDAM
ncbi:MAG: U32 family peptidase, partial [Bacillota bacterium]|nr:U32 family peptidase [Bacillota bacterium]